MKILFRSLFIAAFSAVMLLSFPACNQQSAETAKKFYEEVEEKTNAYQEHEAKHEEKRAAEHGDKQAEPAAAPQKLVPDGK